MYDEQTERLREAYGRHRGPDFDRGMPRDHRMGGRGHERGGRGHGGPGHGGPGRGWGFGFPGMFGRGPAVRRGDVRSAILALLVEGPMHGYQIMRELTERSGGTWRPSAGSIYPTLQQLEDEGLVRGEERDGRRAFSLTDRGRAAAAKVQEAGLPWETDPDQVGAELNTLVMQLVLAVVQVRQVGSTTAMGEARKVLVGARREMYRLLAEDDLGEGDPEADAATGGDVAPNATDATDESGTENA